MTSTLTRTGRRLAALAAFAGTLVFAPAALASTAANTTITNTATVSYNDSGGNAQTPVTATAAVTVTLIPAAVTLSSPANQTISQGATATLTYTITSTANGPDTYNLSSTATPSSVTAATLNYPSNIILGGTTLAVATTNTDTSITVPYDGNPSNAAVNGLAVGSVIVIGGNAVTITTIAKNSGTNTTVIGLSGPVGAVVAVGQIVGERKTFNVVLNPSGTVTSGNSGTQTVNTTAVSSASATQTTTQTTPTVVTVQRPSLTVAKTVSTDGVTFTASVNAPPATALFYRIVVTNSGSSAANTVAFTDVVPQYLAYVVGTGKFATSSATSYATATALTEGSGGYSYTAATQTVAYNPGSPTGDVPAGGELVLFFKATIN